MSKVKGSVRMTMSVPRPWAVRAGQYLNIWIPSLGFWQSHPFVIADWSDGSMLSLVFLVEPKDGFTRKLLTSGDDMELAQCASQYRLAFFTGPHGLHVPMGDYGNVLLIATGFGIAAQVTYVKELIRDYHKCRVRTRRIHLVWQIQKWGKANILKCQDGANWIVEDRLVALDLINEALTEDSEQDAYVNPTRTTFFAELTCHCRY